MLVTEKAANQEDVDDSYRQHEEQLESRPEVDTLKVVLLDAAVSKLNMRKHSLQLD